MGGQHVRVQRALKKQLQTVALPGATFLLAPLLLPPPQRKGKSSGHRLPKRVRISWHNQRAGRSFPPFPARIMSAYDSIQLYARYALAGSLCASSAHMILVPIDVVKTRMQVRKEKESQTKHHAAREGSLFWSLQRLQRHV